MFCPVCEEETRQKVVDKRNNGPENSIRRRRECLECGTRFTTFELRSDCIDFPEEEEEEELTYEEVRNYFPLPSDQD